MGLFGLKNSPAFASAMTRLANQTLSEVDPAPSKRIAMAQDYQKPA